MKYRYLLIPLMKLKSCFTKYYQNPTLLENHKQSEFFQRVKESVDKVGLINPLIVEGPDADSVYTVIIGNNRLFALQELEDPAYEVLCVMSWEKGADYKELKKLIYKEW